MQERVHYTLCPVCAGADIHPVLEARDYTVSHELFEIWECTTCTLRFTQKVPHEQAIGAYYKSENYISHSNTKKGLVNGLYHWVRKRTLVKKRKLVQAFTGLKKGSLLDIGSGTGAFLAEMQQNEWTVTGLEPDAGAREVAKKSYGLTLDTSPALFSLPPQQFDAITLWHVLEHVHALSAYMTQLKKILKDKGKIFIAVPNYTSSDAVIYQQYWAAYDVPRHLYHFSPTAMQQLVEKQGMKIQAYKPMWYDSFYVALLSSKYKNKKMNLPAAFWNGLRSNMKAFRDVKKCSSVIYVISK